uniref:Uncharacterized protein n=1 Tax=Oryza punctata TaxID=4537 RepID=A0A0E0M364_ORYPU
MSGEAPPQIDQVGGNGVVVGDGGQEMQDVADPNFTMMRNTMRDRIFEYAVRKQSSTDCQWRLRASDLAKRLEDIMYSMFQTKIEYYYMMKGPVEPQLQIAIKRLISAQNQQNQQMPKQMTSSSGHGTRIPTPGITQDATGNSRTPNVPDDAGLPSSAGESKDDGEPDGQEANEVCAGTIHNQQFRE